MDLKVSDLAWFPDGDKLLASAVAEKDKVSSVWKISILGGRPVKIRDGVEFASVSPDGSQIAFVSGGGKEIWVGAVGEEPRQLLTSNGRVLSDAWSGSLMDSDSVTLKIPSRIIVIGWMSSPAI